MDSTLAVQQYIQQLIRKDFSSISDILKAPDSQDEGRLFFFYLILLKMLSIFFFSIDFPLFIQEYGNMNISGILFVHI